MLSRILSQVCSQTKYKLFFSQTTYTNAILCTRFSKSLILSKSKTRLLTTVPSYQSNSVNAKISTHNFSSLSSPVLPTIKYNNTPANSVTFPNKIPIRTYFAPYTIFKEWVNTKSYRSDKWYRYQRSKRRRHKKWLKKTRVKRLVKKTLMENKVKAMREKEALAKEKQKAWKIACEERRVTWQLKFDEAIIARNKKRRESYDRHEKLMKEMKEKKLEKLRRKALEESSAGNAS